MDTESGREKSSGTSTGHILHDATSHPLVGEPPVTSAHVVGHVRGIRGGGDGAGDGGEAEDELEEDLRPARAVDLLGPAGPRPLAPVTEERASLEPAHH